jgi:nitroreductase
MNKILGFLTLIANHLYEIGRFIQFSNMVSLNSEEKLRGKIIFRYHSIEKGLINDPLRYNFGIDKIKRLLYYLRLWENSSYPINDSQFLSACAVLQHYWVIHKQKGLDVSDIISLEDYKFIAQFSKDGKGGAKSFMSDEYFSNSNAPFDNFSNSRHSVRHFNGVLVETDVVREVVKLARNSPSVCNRQGFRVKFVNDNYLVKQALEIQGGLNATAKTVKQILIVSVDRGVFVSASEWYQGFIDGGIFLQNLLYSLHFRRIGAVPLNWSKHFTDDSKLERTLGLPKAEKIIALVAIGYPIDNFKVPISTRKNVEEILTIID